jgi:4-hydroxy-2-oxoheptanedioate aldolase
LHVFSIPDAQRRVAEGWQFVALNSELKFMLEGATSLLEAVHPERVSAELAKY